MALFQPMQQGPSGSAVTPKAEVQDTSVNSILGFVEKAGTGLAGMFLMGEPFVWINSNSALFIFSPGLELLACGIPTSTSVFANCSMLSLIRRSLAVTFTEMIGFTIHTFHLYLEV